MSVKKNPIVITSCEGNALAIHGTGFEYWCPSCRQLRLFVNGSKHKFTGCGGCGSDTVVKGAPGTLNREALEKEHPAT